MTELTPSQRWALQQRARAVEEVGADLVTDWESILGDLVIANGTIPVGDVLMMLVCVHKNAVNERRPRAG
jgi:hypothetical protein